MDPTAPIAELPLGASDRVRDQFTGRLRAFLAERNSDFAGACRVVLGPWAASVPIGEPVTEWMALGHLLKFGISQGLLPESCRPDRIPQRLWGAYAASAYSRSRAACRAEMEAYHATKALELLCRTLVRLPLSFPAGEVMKPKSVGLDGHTIEFVLPQFRPPGKIADQETDKAGVWVRVDGGGWIKTPATMAEAGRLHMSCQTVEELLARLDACKPPAKGKKGGGAKAAESPAIDLPSESPPAVAEPAAEPAATHNAPARRR